MSLVLKAARNDAQALVVLAAWYAAHSAIRRLWAVQELRGMRVIVTLEPTHDGDDFYPAWLAKGDEWARELERSIDGPVALEVTNEPFAADGVLVAELFWRDPSMAPDEAEGWR